jgi:hypothetical protein
MTDMNRCRLTWLVAFVVMVGVAVVGLSAPEARAYEPVAQAQTTSGISSLPFLSTPQPDVDTAAALSSRAPVSLQTTLAPRSPLVSPVVGLIVLILAVGAVATGYLVRRRRTNAA